MTYQRGTDLPSCQTNCEFSERFCHRSGNAIGGGLVELWHFYCNAEPSDTCPREQAEKPAETCATCRYFEFTSLMCLRYPVATETRGYRTCGEWKERTNG